MIPSDFYVDSIDWKTKAKKLYEIAGYFFGCNFDSTEYDKDRFQEYADYLTEIKKEL
jgi:hypothetical protein